MDDLDDMDEAPTTPRAPSPEAAAIHVQATSPRQRTASIHRPQTTTRSRSQHAEARTPVLDHFQLSQLSTRHVPGTRIGERPRSHNGTVNDFDSGFDEGHRPFMRIESSLGGPEDRSFVRNGSLVAGALANRPGHPRSTFSDDVIPAAQKTIPIGRQSIMSNESLSRLPDFFSYGIFQVVLRNPTTAHQLLKFSETRLCSENIVFLSKVSYPNSWSEIVPFGSCH